MFPCTWFGWQWTLLLLAVAVGSRSRSVLLLLFQTVSTVGRRHTHNLLSLYVPTLHSYLYPHRLLSMLYLLCPTASYLTHTHNTHIHHTSSLQNYTYTRLGAPRNWIAPTFRVHEVEPQVNPRQPFRPMVSRQSPNYPTFRLISLVVGQLLLRNSGRDIHFSHFMSMSFSLFIF